MHRWPLLAVALSALLLGCTQEGPPLPPVPPAPEDLSFWSLPELVQPAHIPAPDPTLPKDRPTPAEKVYDFVSGSTYHAPVLVAFPLDVVLEQGEELRNYVGGDPEPLAEGQQANRWEIKPGTSGKDTTARTHLFIRATEAGLKMGLVVTTSKRIYYLTCESVKTSPIRALRWRYAPDPSLPQAPKESGLLPDPQDLKRWHVGYTVAGSRPHIEFLPRYVVDEGKKVYIVFPEISLFQRVPVIRLIGPNGPMLTNSRQFLNVVIVDELFARAELRFGVGEQADIVTITRANLHTIDCPSDPECPVWPAAAQALARKGTQP